MCGVIVKELGGHATCSWAFVVLMIKAGKLKIILVKLLQLTLELHLTGVDCKINSR